MRDLCYSVRLSSLTLIRSGKSYHARSFNGSEDFIPAQFVYGEDWDVAKSEAYWISAWILERKSIQYSSKKSAWFDRDTRKRLPDITFKKHIPKQVENKNVKPDDDLTR